MDEKKNIVISAINIREGGALTILRDCLNFLSSSPISRLYRVIALVHRKDIANFPNINYIEFPDSAKSWIKRLYYEYFYFNKISQNIHPFLWLSLHDMTPYVKADIQAVYMHNPSIISKIKFTDLKFDKKYILFAFFYKYLYRINIKKNKYCIVQQNWFKNVCLKKLGLPESKMIVARPKQSITEQQWSKKTRKYKNFFYPAYPRPFKNFETICEAVKIIENYGIKDLKFYLTVDENCGEYGKWIYHKYKDIKSLYFLGILSPDKVNDFYLNSDCLIFPSRLETWGLPISEFLSSERPMIIADEPYAHETAAGGKQVAFFNTNDPYSLSKIIVQLISDDFSSFKVVQECPTAGLTANSYDELFDILLNNGEHNCQ